MKTKKMLHVLRFAVFALFAVAVLTFLVMNLWNWLMPVLFARPVISYWQALGLLILSRVFFGGFRARHGYGDRWQGRFRERWGHMTPEQRQKFEAGLGRPMRCWSGESHSSEPVVGSPQEG